MLYEAILMCQNDLNTFLRCDHFKMKKSQEVSSFSIDTLRTHRELTASIQFCFVSESDKTVNVQAERPYPWKKKSRLHQ